MSDYPQIRGCCVDAEIPKNIVGAIDSVRQFRYVLSHL